jgi:hypothetical protein
LNEIENQERLQEGLSMIGRLGFLVNVLSPQNKRDDEDELDNEPDIDPIERLVDHESLRVFVSFRCSVDVSVNA